MRLVVLATMTPPNATTANDEGCEEIVMLMVDDCGGSDAPEELQDRPAGHYDGNEDETEAESECSYETIDGGATIDENKDDRYELRDTLRMEWLQEQARFALERHAEAHSHIEPNTPTTPSCSSNMDGMHGFRSAPPLYRFDNSPSPYSRRLETAYHDCQKECEPSMSNIRADPMRVRPFWWTEKQYINWWSAQQMEHEYEEAFRGPCSDQELNLKLKAFDQHWYPEDEDESSMYQWQVTYHKLNPDERSWDTHEEMVEGMEERYLRYKSNLEIALFQTKRKWLNNMHRYNRPLSHKVFNVFKTYLEHAKGKYEGDDNNDDKTLPIPYFSAYNNDSEVDYQICKQLSTFFITMRAYYEDECPKWLYEFVTQVVEQAEEAEGADVLESDLVEEPSDWKPWEG